MAALNIYRLQAELFHHMSNPTRLKILLILVDYPTSVKEIIILTGLPQSIVSKHLMVLKKSNLVISQRRGLENIYSVANPKIGEMCNLLQVMISEQFTERAKTFL